MITMLEKAARACVERFDPSEWDDLSPREQEQSKEIVRTVLEAIRDPDEPVRAAGALHTFGTDAQPDHVWRGMVDAILQAKP